MNTPWEQGISNQGPLLPYGGGKSEWEYQPTRIPGYEVTYGAYTTLTKGVFLPAGTVLPGGANFAHQAVIDFPLQFPVGTTVPGGIMVPVSLVKKAEPKPTPPQSSGEMLCSIQ